VNNANLANFARRLGFAAFALCGPRAPSGAAWGADLAESDKLLADCFEAFFGALYLEYPYPYPYLYPYPCPYSYPYPYPSPFTVTLTLTRRALPRSGPRRVPRRARQVPLLARRRAAPTPPPPPARVRVRVRARVN